MKTKLEAIANVTVIVVALAGGWRRAYKICGVLPRPALGSGRRPSGEASGPRLEPAPAHSAAGLEHWLPFLPGRRPVLPEADPGAAPRH